MVSMPSWEHFEQRSRDDREGGPRPGPPHGPLVPVHLNRSGAAALQAVRGVRRCPPVPTLHPEDVHRRLPPGQETAEPALQVLAPHTSIYITSTSPSAQCSAMVCKPVKKNLA